MNKLHTEIIQKIVRQIEQAQNNSIYQADLYQNKKGDHNKNEFIFFVKPEVTLPGVAVNLTDVLTLIFNKIDEFRFSIKQIKLLSAQYLADNQIIADHYGVINRLARNAKANFMFSTVDKFYEVYKTPFEDATILGGLEFIEKYPAFNPDTLSYLWQNAEVQKLASGTYCAAVKLDGQAVYIINGFHPRQLAHYTQSGRSIILFVLSSNISWQSARNLFVGATNPTNAQAGSIRRELLENRAKFGLPNIDMSNNGVHLSAGPVEALVELIRFCSDYTCGQKLSFDNFSFGKALSQSFDLSQIAKILDNDNVTADGKITSVFDFTEEKDSDVAISLLKAIGL